jgi:hypothetical protein
MRLSPEQIVAIREVARSVVGPSAVTRLFGSRTSDKLRGGDIDLHIDVTTPVESAAGLSARIGVRLQQVLGERRFDVLISAPNLPQHAIHRIARESGVEI